MCNDSRKSTREHERKVDCSDEGTMREPHCSVNIEKSLMDISWLVHAQRHQCIADDYQPRQMAGKWIVQAILQERQTVVVVLTDCSARIASTIKHFPSKLDCKGHHFNVQLWAEYKLLLTKSEWDVASTSSTHIIVISSRKKWNRVKHKSQNSEVFQSIDLRLSGWTTRCVLDIKNVYSDQIWIFYKWNGIVSHVSFPAGLCLQLSHRSPPSSSPFKKCKLVLVVLDDGSNMYVFLLACSFMCSGADLHCSKVVASLERKRCCGSPPAPGSPNFALLLAVSIMYTPVSVELFGISYWHAM